MKLNNLKTQFADKKIDKWEYIDKMYSIHSVLFEYSDFIKSTNIRSINISDGKVIMTFRDSGIKFICANNDKRLAPLDTLNFDSYEEVELAMQMELIENNDKVFDVGGNYGWYCLHIAQRFPDAKIFSFEPLPETFSHLNENISLNGFKNITTVKIGLSDAVGSFSFYYDPELSVNASLQNVSGKSGVEQVTCQVDTIDNYCHANNLSIDFLKCDVEGAELLAFKGGIETIKRDCPIIFSEMLRKWTSKFDYHPNDIIEFFANLGYNCYTLDRMKLKPFDLVNENTRETNYFFLHKVKHQDKIGKYSISL